MPSKMVALRSLLVFWILRMQLPNVCGKEGKKEPHGDVIPIVEDGCSRVSVASG